MNLLIIDGSCRENGNGAYLAKIISEKSKSISNISVKTVHLRAITYTGCNACGDCRKSPQICTIEDELKPFYEYFINADNIALISPSYYGFPAGSVKQLIDRWYCMKLPEKKSRFKENVKFLFFLTQGSPYEEKSETAVKWLERIMTNHGCDYYATILTECNFDDNTAVKENKSNINKITELLSYI